MAERSMTSGRGALVVALAVALGAAAGASWQRRAAGTGGSIRSGAFRGEVASRPLGDGPGRIQAGFVPPAIVGLLPPKSSPARIRDHSRNLFNFEKSPEDLAKEMKNKAAADERERLAKIERDRMAAQLAANAAAQEAWELAHPDPPAVTLSFIGKIGAPRAPMAVLAGADGEVHVACVGETIAAKFRLLSLDHETATIGYAPALVAARPEWASATTVLRMGVR